MENYKAVDPASFAYKIWKNHRSEPYYALIKNGVKIVESRIKKGKYKEIRPGDHIVINTNDETDNFEVKVSGVRNYPTFRELLEKETLAKVMPNMNSIDEALKEYEKFYTKDQEKKYGVVAIEIRKI